MKWIDRQPIEGLLYKEPAVVIFDLDRVARPGGQGGPAIVRLWRRLLHDLRQRAYLSRVSAAHGWPLGTHRDQR